MRISYWNSDLCSSELVAGPGLDRLDAELLARAHAPGRDREELGVGLAVDEGKGIAPPVARLGQVLLLGGPDLQAAEPVDRGRPLRLGQAHLPAGLLEHHVGVHEVADAHARKQDRMSTRLNYTH